MGRRPALPLTEGQQATLKAIVLQGPDPEVDGVSTWRLVDLCRIVRERFGVTSGETGMGQLMRDLDPVPIAAALDALR